MKAILCALGVVFVSTACLADGWTPPLTVSSVMTENNDLVIISTADGSTYQAGCTGGQWVFVGDTDARRNRAMMLALTALTTGQPIRFWYYSNSSSETPCAAYNYQRTISLSVSPP